MGPSREKLKHCLQLFEKLSEYVDNELDADTRRQIEAHAEACCNCRICLETLKRTVGLLKRIERQPIPSRLSARLRKTIQDALHA